MFHASNLQKALHPDKPFAAISWRVQVWKLCSSWNYFYLDREGLQELLGQCPRFSFLVTYHPDSFSHRCLWSLWNSVLAMNFISLWSGISQLHAPCYKPTDSPFSLASCVIFWHSADLNDSESCCSHCLFSWCIVFSSFDYYNSSKTSQRRTSVHLLVDCPDYRKPPNY